MFWGLPPITIEGRHGPEIVYLINNYTGLIAKGKDDLRICINKVANDEQLLKTLSSNAQNCIQKEANTKKMFEGFIEAIEYINKTKGFKK